MDFPTFAKEKPVLYGQITVNGKSKIGHFKPIWHSLTNTLQYIYHSPKGRKGKEGFTLKRAFDLLSNNRLSLDPTNGNPSNYL